MTYGGMPRPLRVAINRNAHRLALQTAYPSLCEALEQMARVMMTQESVSIYQVIEQLDTTNEAGAFQTPAPSHWPFPNAYPAGQ
jgi:hypothetical protein